MSARPPRVPEFLLERLLPSGECEFLLGDLQERYGDLVAKNGSAVAYAWYWMQVLKALGSLPRLWCLQRSGWGGMSSQERPSREGGSRLSGALLLADGRMAVRSLRRSPTFSLLAIGSISAGLVLTVVIFSFVQGILLAPLPFKNPGELMRLDVARAGVSWTSFTELQFAHIRNRSRSIASLSAYRRTTRILDGETPMRVQVGRVEGSLFDVLGVDPMLGRRFLDSEKHPGGGRVAILSHALWASRFGGDPTVLGTMVRLDGEAYQVIGVMQAGFYFPDAETALWIPYYLVAQGYAAAHNINLSVVARRKAGVSFEQARSEIQALGQSFARENPEFVREGFAIRARPLREAMVAQARPLLLVLLAGVAFLLLTACANVATLLLARGHSRKREIATLAALGVSPARLACRCLLEGLVLAGVGGVVALVLTPLGIRVLRRFTLGMAGAQLVGWTNLPRIQEVKMDPRIFFFAFTLIVLTGVLLGTLPALHARGLELARALRKGGGARAGSRADERIRSAIVGIEVAFAVVLATGSGVMFKTVARLSGIDPGMRTDDVLTVRVDLPLGTPRTDQETVSAFATIRERIRQLPGAGSVEEVSRLPLAQAQGFYSFAVDGQDAAGAQRGARRGAVVLEVSPGYLQAVGVRLLEGRFLDEGDSEGRPSVAVIDETMARQSWPGESPLGRRIRFSPWPPGSAGPEPLEIVGVVGDVRQRNLTDEPEPKLYLTHAQAAQSYYDGPRSSMTLVMAGASHALSAASVARAIRSVEPRAVIDHFQWMSQVRAQSMADRVKPALLLGVFGFLATLMAAMGIYGVVSFSVRERLHQTGIRVAVGATPRDVQRWVAGMGLRPVLAGLGAGLLLALAFTRGLRSLLYGTTPTDPGTYAAVITVFLLVSLLATAVPAVRASRIDAMDLLRSE
jgi:putative ABC transport system permease protein